MTKSLRQITRPERPLSTLEQLAQDLEDYTALTIST